MSPCPHNIYSVEPGQEQCRKRLRAMMMTRSLKCAVWLAIRVFQRVIPSCHHEHGPQRLPTTRCADWSAQVTLSIAEEAVNWSSLSNVIWIELWKRQRTYAYIYPVRAPLYLSLISVWCIKCHRALTIHAQWLDNPRMLLTSWSHACRDCTTQWYLIPGVNRHSSSNYTFCSTQTLTSFFSQKQSFSWLYLTSQSTVLWQMEQICSYASFFFYYNTVIPFCAWNYTFIYIQYVL